MAKVSIIVRTKNESRWIAYCLNSLKNQVFDGEFEVIVVDSGSEDNTLEIVELVAPKTKVIVPQDDVYLPGKFINYGISAAATDSDYIAILSAHCVPTSKKWLQGMIDSIESQEAIVGVYCKQIPCRSTNFENKRDLVNSFGDETIIKSKDTFFHNAASVVSKATLASYPFSSTAKHIEDRLWAEDVLSAGYKIKYDASISVTHEHGLNQHTNKYSSLRGEGVAKLQKDSTDLLEFESNLRSLTRLLLIAVNYEESTVSQVLDRLGGYNFALDVSEGKGEGLSLKELITKKLKANIEAGKTFYDFVLYVNCAKLNGNLPLSNLCDAAISRNADMCFYVDEIANDYFVMDNHDNRLIVRTEDVMNKYSAKEHVKVALYEHGTFIRSNYLLNNEALGETLMFSYVKSTS